MPLLTKDGRVNVGDHNLSVAELLKPGYLTQTDQLAAAGKVGNLWKCYLSPTPSASEIDKIRAGIFYEPCTCVWENKKKALKR